MPYPSIASANVSATHVQFDVWEWNAMYSLIYANGGPDTSKGSQMEKYGVNLTLHREDSNSQMKADLLTCAKQLHDGEKSCSSGAEAIVVMGDSGGQWLADLNPQLKKLGPEYQAVIIGAVGRSNGEDALLGPLEWKSNPLSMKGKTVVGVIRDGDWNIALNYMGSNGLKNNPDLKTYDPDAVNWISAPDEDYIKAVTDVSLIINEASSGGHIVPPSNSSTNYLVYKAIKIDRTNISCEVNLKLGSAGLEIGIRLVVHRAWRPPNSIMENHVQQRFIYVNSSVIFNKSQLAKAIHKKAHA